MKNIYKILVFLSFLLPLFSFAEERIENFYTVIRVNPDSSIRVEEKIVYNFDNLINGAEKHGIFRIIPFKYKTGYRNFNFIIKDINVPGYGFVASDEGNYKKIKIGDPNILVSGTKEYYINYTVERAVGYFNDFDEIYWNATGNEWEVPIINSSSVVLLPERLKSNELRIACYEGPIGSKTGCSFTEDYSKSDISLVDQVTYAGTRQFRPGEGLTVALGFPKGIVSQPTFYENILSFFDDNLLYGIPFIVFLFMLGFLYLFGRDPKGTGVIIPQYDVPENLSPIEISVILNQKIRNKDISAEIIHLAIRGFIKITRISKTDYLFKKNKNKDETLKNFEIELIDALFYNQEQFRNAISSGNIIFREQDKKVADDLSGGVKLTSLGNDFYQKINNIKSTAVSYMKDVGYFRHNPQRYWFRVILFSLLFLGIVFAYLIKTIEQRELIPYYIVSSVSCFIIIFFSYFISHRTKKGVLLKEHLLGLKEYLQIAEKDRIIFHNAPEKKPEIFEKLLPYAMVIGVEKAWAKEFESIYNPETSDWYNDSITSPFDIDSFISSLNSFSSYAALATISSGSGDFGGSGSDGGGSSGGGGGGGGGGSW